MNGLKKTLSIMLCVAMIASGSFMAFAEGESNPLQVANGGSLTVDGSGTVDNVSHRRR